MPILIHGVGTNPEEFDPAGSAQAVQEALTSHTGNKANPHSVTAEQVGALPLSGGALTGMLRFEHGGSDSVYLQSSSAQGSGYPVLCICTYNNDLPASVSIGYPQQADHATTKGYVDGKTLVFADKAISPSAWSSNSTYSAQGYHWRAAVACAGATANHRPDVAFGIDDAVGGNFAPVAESYAGGVYLYCKSKPAATVTVKSIVCIKGA